MTDLTPLVEDAARAAEEAMRDISVCEGADGMSYGLLDAMAEARCEKEPSGASDVLRDAALDVSLRTLLAFHNPDSEAGKALVEVMAINLYRFNSFGAVDFATEWPLRKHGDPDAYEGEKRWHRNQARAALTAIARALSEQGQQNEGAES